MSGTFWRTQSSGTARAAAMAPRVAFLDPLTAMVPCRRWPPSMSRVFDLRCAMASEEGGECWQRARSKNHVACLMALFILNAGRARSGTCATAAAFGDLQADERFLELSGNASEVDVRFPALELLLRAAAGFLGAGDVDLLSALGGVGEDGHAVVADFEEAAGDGHVGLVVAALDAHDAGLDHREQGGVHGEDGEFALDAGGDDFVDTLLGEDE